MLSGTENRGIYFDIFAMNVLVEGKELYHGEKTCFCCIPDMKYTSVEAINISFLHCLAVQKSHFTKKRRSEGSHDHAISSRFLRKWTLHCYIKTRFLFLKRYGLVYDHRNVHSLDTWRNAFVAHANTELVPCRVVVILNHGIRCIPYKFSFHDYRTSLF